MKQDALSIAIDVADLPALVAELYPATGAIPGRERLVKAVWRGEDDPSFSIFRRDDTWFYKDHGTGQSGNAFTFLRDIANLPPQEAAHMLIERAGLTNEEKKQGRLKGRMATEAERLPRSERTPLSPQEIEKALTRHGFDVGASKAFSGRGFTKKDLDRLALMGNERGDGAFPIFDPFGIIVGLKRRYHNPPRHKYDYLVSERGSPAWCNPGFGRAPRVLMVEGELNAMIAWSVLSEYVTDIDVMGIAGSNGGPYWEALTGKEVFIYADGGEDKNEARAIWPKVAKLAEASECRLMPPTRDGRDFCDIAGQDGREALLKALTNLIRTARPIFTELSSTIGFYTRQELLESHERFMKGEILKPFGFPELDDYTGGIPDSGLVMICALSTVGKSAWLRDVLANHLEQNKDHRVMLFSPDQSVPSIMRLLAARKSGIPALRARKGRFTPAMLDLWGGPEGVRKQYDMIYKETVLEYSKRFVVSERQRLSQIQQEVDWGMDHGVTLFGGDYLQSFEMDLDKGRSMEEGIAVSIFRDWVRERKTVFVLAVQLAKYKFPPSRKSGIPYIDDIEGKGKIGQQAEHTLMLYNYDRWRAMGRKEEEIRQPLSEYHRMANSGTYTPLVRIYVRKNREGPSDDFMYLAWDREIPRFRPWTEAEDSVSDPMPWKDWMADGGGI